MGPGAMILLVFWMLSFKPTFSLSSFTFIKRLFSSSSLSAVTSSQIGSKSSTAGDITKQDQVIKDVQDAAKNIDGADSADSTATVDSSQYIDDWG